jgi:transcriptional antiterminator RfaH
MSFWSVVQTESQHEQLVRQWIMRFGLETYLPRIKHRKRIQPLFPTYLFVRIVDQWYPIRWTCGVVRILMAGETPARLDEEIIISIRQRERSGFVKLPVNIRRGEEVRILRGHFEGKTAIFDGATAHDRNRVLMDLLGQMVPVELPAKDIQAIRPIQAPLP